MDEDKDQNKPEGGFIGIEYDPLAEGQNVQRPGIQKDEECSKIGVCTLHGGGVVILLQFVLSVYEQ